MTALELISEILRRNVNLSGDTFLADVNGWDSLRSVRLVLRIEEQLDRELTETEIENIRSVGDVDRLLAGPG